MNELATALLETEDSCYPMIQRLLDPSLEEITVNGVSIDKYTISVSKNAEVYAARYLKSIVKEATGYNLPIVVTESVSNNCFVVDAEGDGGYGYYVDTEGAVVTISAGNMTSAAAAARAVKLSENDGNYTVKTIANGAAYNYDSLYVGYNAETGEFDDASLILDFFYATDRADAVQGKYSTKYTSYEDYVADVNNYATGSAASELFQGLSSSYTPYITYAGKYKDSKNKEYPVSISGGTAAIVSPWWFNNNYTEGYWPYEGGKAQSGSGVAPKKDDAGNITTPGYVSTATKTIVTGVTDYYISNAGKWAKLTRKSDFGNGYFHMGNQYSYLTFSNAVSATQPNSSSALTNDYTIQFISARVGASGAWDTFLCFNRGTISETFVAGKPVIKLDFTGSTTSLNLISPNLGATGTEENPHVSGDIDKPNTFTFTFDCYTADDESTKVKLAAYVNSTLALSQENAVQLTNADAKIFEQADANIYAIRVYKKALSADEIAQNHFADLAKYFQLELTDFDALDANEKKAVYATVKDFTFDSAKADVQAAVDKVVYDLVSVTVIIGEETTEKFVSLKGDVVLAAPEANEARVFNGYFNAVEGGDRIIDANGKLVEGKALADGDTLYAQFTLKYKVTYGDKYVYVLPGESFTIEPDVANNLVFEGYMANGEKVADSKGTMLKDYVISSDIELTAITYDMHDALYVGWDMTNNAFGSNMLYFIDFYDATSATNTTNPLIGQYPDDTSKTVYNRFKVPASCYTDFVRYSVLEDTAGNYIGGRGGWAPIPANTDFFILDAYLRQEDLAEGVSWSYSRYASMLNPDTYDAIVAKGNLSKYTGTTDEVIEGTTTGTNITSWTGSYKFQDTVAGETASTYHTVYTYRHYKSDLVLNTDYALSDDGTQIKWFREDGQWRKKISTARYDFKSLYLGMNGQFSVSDIYTAKLDGVANGYIKDFNANAQTDAEKADNGFTIQVITSNPSKNAQQYYVGINVSLNVVKGGHSSTFGGYNTDAINLNCANEFTFTHTYTAATKTDVSLYSNTTYIGQKTGNTLDTSFKVCEQGETKLYALRVYDNVLTAEEVAQNHFADLMSYYEIDVRDFVLDVKSGVVSEEELAAIYAAMSDTTDGDDNFVREYYIEYDETKYADMQTKVKAKFDSLYADAKAE